jgi:ribosomal subunit interface protein
MLDYNLKITNVDLDDEIRDRLNAKLVSLEKLLDPNDESVQLDIELEKTTDHHRTGKIFRAEINLHISGKVFRIEATEDSFSRSIDEAKDRVVRQINDFKNKRNLKR